MSGSIWDNITVITAVRVSSRLLRIIKDHGNSNFFFFFFLEFEHIVLQPWFLLRADNNWCLMVGKPALRKSYRPPHSTHCVLL